MKNLCGVSRRCCEFGDFVGVEFGTFREIACLELPNSQKFLLRCCITCENLCGILSRCCEFRDFEGVEFGTFGEIVCSELLNSLFDNPTEFEKSASFVVVFRVKVLKNFSRFW